ncbi:ADP-ribosylation factor-like protein 2 isoform X2 [Macrosteles quadrilineatus]|uniref:ADP-ribosylation factor-like protein 2 isoform X2 n=1 Tax=Macrosteles quadrilineatus TaxID=74068 RepID=UPI0023E335F7|nr:ADP-ribosylation factor-like protein 2 isoform X2 [Macrosteles quadrilineatus]
MGLLTVIKKMKQKEKEMRILMLGLDNAGKTTILKRINGEEIDTISPTLGFNIKTLEHKGYQLNIWDVGGQKSLRSYWRNYFESTDGLIWVVDSADKRRLEDCKRELYTLLQEEGKKSGSSKTDEGGDTHLEDPTEFLNIERLLGATLLVFANKQDLPGSLTSEEIKTVVELDSIKSHHWRILPCSAVTGDNLVVGIDWLVSDIAARIFTLD